MLAEIGAVRIATNRAAGRAGTAMNIGSAIALAVALLGFCIAFLRSARLRRQAERARLFGELLVESSVEGIVVLDRELRYRIWNRGMEQMTGMSRDEVVGREGLELFPFLPEGGTLRVWETALAGETVAWTTTRSRSPRPARSASATPSTPRSSTRRARSWARSRWCAT